MAYQLIHLDTCTSDYFRGYHNPTIQIPVDGNTTYLDIKKDLLDLSWATDHIEDLNTLDYLMAVNECFEVLETNNMMKEKFQSSIEVCPEDEEDNWETCYIFFGLDTVEED